MQPLPDVQSYTDSRNLRINKVGVTKVPWAFSFAPTSDAVDQAQPTVGSLDMFVTLPADKKGTHMSRFVELLASSDRLFSYDRLAVLFDQVKERLSASQVFGAIRFPFFIDRSAPVTGRPGQLQLQVLIEICAGQQRSLTTTVSGPATSLCPCSKEISDYGAHNQRCELTVSVMFNAGCEVGVDELFSMVDTAASCSVFPTLKRADEKSVTEAAYNNPKFVEDTVRDMAVRLQADSRLSWFRCSSENYESIHQHNAYAEFESER